MDKKGVEERQFFWIFYMIVIVVVTLAVISFVTNAVSKSGLDEEYYARDLAYMIDLIQAGNGDVEFNYKIENSQFDFFIGKVDGKYMVVVGKQLSEDGRGTGIKSYGYNSRVEYGLFEKPSNILLRKENVETS